MDTYTTASIPTPNSTTVAAKLDQIEAALVQAHNLLTAVVDPLPEGGDKLRVQGVLADLDHLNELSLGLVSRIEGLVRLVDRQL